MITKTQLLELLDLVAVWEKQLEHSDAIVVGRPDAKKITRLVRAPIWRQQTLFDWKENGEHS